MTGAAPGLSRQFSLDRTWPFILDILVFATVLAVFYGVLTIAHYWLGQAVPVTEISRSPWSLPRYAFYSLVRMGIAYFLSLIFAVVYGRIAAHNETLQPFMVAILDILQSIPVLSFLPGVMLAMVALFPSKQVGVELGSIVLIFTGQVWNMAFSFYSSLKSMPRELSEAAAIYRFGKWQRFFQLELPYGTIGLLWNSIVSVAGGWFFLMACEMFVLGKRDFRLPGLGSYLQTAAGNGDTYAMLWGLFAMIAVILLIDQLIWRPAIAWSAKFKFEQVESTQAPTSPLLHLMRNSHLLNLFREKTVAPLGERINLYFARRKPAHPASGPSPTWLKALGAVLAVVAIAGVGYEVFRAVALLRGVNGAEFSGLMRGAAATFLRVNVSLLIASAWTIPAGVAIGFNPRLARIMQPVTQVGLRPGHARSSPSCCSRSSNSAARLARVGCADAAWHAVVHPVQRDCRCQRNSFGPQGSGQPVSLQPGGAVADRDPAGHFSLSGHGAGHRVGWGVEREYCGRVLSFQGLGDVDSRTRRADQRSDGRRTVRYAADGHDHYGDAGCIVPIASVWWPLYRLAETKIPARGLN